MTPLVTQVIIPKACPIYFISFVNDPHETITEWYFHVFYLPKILADECDWIEPIE